VIRFAIGYQLAPERALSFADRAAEFAGHIAEVYFPWIGLPSGRAPFRAPRGQTAAATRRFERDLQDLRTLGVKLNLLMNANCYGGGAVSEALARQVTDLLESLRDLVGGVDSVTTTSPAVAQIVKTRFPGVSVRGSVNMRIGTAAGMDYLRDWFDAFCVRREVNRDLGQLRELEAWSSRRSIRLELLVNSGCLRECSAQTFHDNLLAHYQQVQRQRNIPGFESTVGICHRYLREPARWTAVLQSTWIRPEDLRHYEGLIDVAKLATRSHADPFRVVAAYASRRYDGNLLDLMEPSFTAVLAPYVIDNRRFPADWFGRTSTCGAACANCGYCGAVLGQVLRRQA
jgi:collagenase-like PrtC family protease